MAIKSTMTWLYIAYITYANSTDTDMDHVMQY